MDMDTDTDMDMDMELGNFTKYLIQRNSPFSAVWNDFYISRHNFQRQYVLLAPFYDEKMTRRFGKIHTTIETALHMMFKRNWKYQSVVEEKPLPEVCTVIGN